MSVAIKFVLKPLFKNTGVFCMRRASEIESDISDVLTSEEAPSLDEFEEYFESAEQALDNLPSDEVFHGADVKMAAMDAIESASELENTIESLATELHSDFEFSNDARFVGGKLSDSMHAISQARREFETVREEGRTLHNNPSNSNAISKAETALGDARPHYNRAKELVKSAVEEMPNDDGLKSDFDAAQRERVEEQERLEPNFDYLDDE